MHIEDDVDGVLFAVAVDLRFDLDKGVTAIAECVGEHRDRVLELLCVVPIAGLHGQERQHRFAREILEPDIDVDLAEPVALTLVDREGDHETVAVGGQLGDRRDDAEIGVALGQIEFAEELAVIGEPVGIVGVGGREKAIPAALFRLNRGAQRAVTEDAIADEVDAAHTGRRSLVNLEDEIDAVFRQLDDLGLDACGEAAAAAVELQNAAHIILHPRAGINGARARLDLCVEILVRDFRVSLEGDAVEDRVLDHPDDQHIAFTVQLDVREEPRVEQRLQRAVDALWIPWIAGLHEQVRAYGLGLDALNAFDADIGDRSGGRCRRCVPRLRRGREHPSRRRDKGRGKQGEPTDGHAL